jgi:hypothetical protein
MQEKERYSAPIVEVLEVKGEGVICLSPQFNNPFNDEKEF